MNPNWNPNHPAVKAWLDYHDNLSYRHYQTRQRMGMRTSTKIRRTQSWWTFGLMTFVGGTIGGTIGGTALLIGCVGLMCLALTIPKGW